LTEARKRIEAKRYSYNNTLLELDGGTPSKDFFNEIDKAHE